MTTARTTAALLLIAAAVGAIGFLLMPNPPARAASPASGPVAAAPDLSTPGAEPLTPGQEAAASAAADRVCEGLTAGVPVTTMETTVAAEGGMSLPAAHDWVAAAAARCAR